MSKIVDYYFTPVSPYAYLGHERLVAIADRRHASINVKPVDLGKVFGVSGGLPLKQRAPQRQAYRLVELERWARYLQAADQQAAGVLSRVRRPRVEVDSGCVQSQCG